MVTKESLIKLYAEASTADLLEIAKDKKGYTEMANLVALEELMRRKVSPEVIGQYEPVLRKIDQSILDHCLIDLKLHLKLLYFFILWFPKARHFYKPEFMQNGYILKSNQSNYYSVLGFVSIVLAFITASGARDDYLFLFLITWGLSFILCYVFDIAFNRQRLTDNIKKQVNKGEIPWGF